MELFGLIWYTDRHKEEKELAATNIERITSTEHPLYQKAMELYQISFPSHEQRETRSQEQILTQEAYHLDIVCDEGEFIGEVLYWEVAGFLYIEHFCILPSMRNKQYGQKILKALQDKTLILEIDPPVDEISIRRKGFYERCGFVENPYRHIHPPYHAGNHGHDLVIMSSPRMLTQSEYDVFFDFLKNTVMKNAY